MSSKEDYLDSLLNSVMQESDQSETQENGEDVTALLDTMSDDGELAEINDLLKQSEESSTSLADDMLALLEQADAQGRENETKAEVPEVSEKKDENELFDFFSDDSTGEAQHAGGDNSYPEEKMPMDEQTAGDGTEWEELLEPTESKAEEKARKKREKQEERARRKVEKEKAKAEKASVKAQKNGAEKENKRNKADTESDGDIPEKETQGTKKQGFFARLLGGLLEEAEEKEEVQEIDISDENKIILEEIGQEEIVPKKEKKKGKKDKKKGKKVSDDQSSGESGEDGQNDKNDKKSKKEAKKKEKREKKAKKAEEAEFLKEPMKKIPRKKVISVFAVCLTFMAIILVCSLLVPSYLDRREARKAYYKGDYETVYHLLTGEKLSGSDAILYERSVLVLYLENKLDAYHLHMALGEEKEALNELFTAVAFYQKNLEHATEYGALEEMQPGYEEILVLLQDTYQVSESQAVEIAQMEALDYNRALYRILYGTDFTIPEMQTDVDENYENADLQEENTGQNEVEPEDVLPEEEELLQQDSGVMIDQDQQTVSQDAETIPQEGQTMSQDAQMGEEAAEDENLLYSGTVQNGQAIVQ